MRKTVLNCFNISCVRSFELDSKEHSKQLKQGKTFFFCSNECERSYEESLPKTSLIELEKICPICTEFFKTVSGTREAQYCSQKCAAKQPRKLSEQTREALRERGRLRTENLLEVSETLKIREGWKYRSLEERLLKEKVWHEFEYEFEGFVFDLALLEQRIFIEFDGPNHNHYEQRRVDSEKDLVAEMGGWKLHRIPVFPNKEICENALDFLLFSSTSNYTSPGGFQTMSIPLAVCAQCNNSYPSSRPNCPRCGSSQIKTMESSGTKNESRIYD